MHEVRYRPRCTHTPCATTTPPPPLMLCAAAAAAAALEALCSRDGLIFRVCMTFAHHHIRRNLPNQVAYIALCVLLLDGLHDTWFYWTHRLLHWRPLYRAVHWEHHRWVVQGRLHVV